ncbi:hypothetical protein COU75_04945 [Candidatus Peregrinibacteria bacterium CG10_big_fil_rev_8_21_14_0_10_42_8]|nr:MAG: hypothetical protein COU75_04945 [Candidatus Peregrinibacteria bacterium CG10_big_fil_rev_8_21_14_0_10_42_8]
MKRPNAASLVVLGFSLGIFASAQASSLGSSVFPDVPNGTYYDSAVGDMYAAGIITGYANGTFGPNDYVTRGQVAVLMQRLKADLTGQSIAVSSSSSSSSRRIVSSSSSSTTSSAVASTESHPAGSFRFTTGSFKADENEGTVLINIIRYGGNKGTVTVEYETIDGTADAGSDYDSTSGRITIADGKTTGSFTVPIIDDNESEGNETVTLKLKDPTGDAALGSPDTATLTIVDNDAGDGSTADAVNSKGVFTFSAPEYEGAEDGESIDITIERTGTSGSASVKYQTSNGTADGNNYDAETATLTFGDGESTKTFTIKIRDNEEKKGNKTVNLKISNPTDGSELGSLSTATLVIVDDELSTFGNGNIRLTEDTYSVFEGDTVKILVDRLKGSKGEVTVKYQTANLLAKSGTDYTETNGTLTFRSGESQKYILIPVLTDSANDPRETFSFTISDPTGGATLDIVKKATITIE